MSNSEFIQAAAMGLIPVAAVVLLRLLGRTEMFQRDDSSDSLVEPLAQEEYRRKSQQFALIYILSFLGLGLALWGGLTFAANVYFMRFGHAAILRLPAIAYGIPGLFLGMVVGYYPADLFLRKTLKERYPSYIKAGELEFGVNSGKLWRYAANFIVIFSAVMYAYELHYTSYIEGDRIHIVKFAELTPRVYERTNVSKILLSHHFIAPNGNIVYRPIFTITFADGFKWQIDAEGDGPGFVEALSQKSGKPIMSEE